MSKEIKPALTAQPEPVGKFAKFTDGIWREVTDGSAGVPLYTTPPQRPWAGLTRDEQSFVYQNLFNATSRTDSFWVDFANAVEAKLKEKNFDT
jgi:hypothetical protein